MARVTHSVRGRLRVRDPTAWLQQCRAVLEQRLRTVPGVRTARGSDVTGSIIIDYDPFALAEKSLLQALDVMATELGARPAADKTAPAVKMDLGRAPLLTLLGTTTALGLSCLPLPSPLLAGLLLASGLPSFGRAGRVLAGQQRLNGDVLEACTLALLALRGDYLSGALLTWLRSVGDYVVTRSVVTTKRSLRDIAVPSDRRVLCVRDGQRKRVLAASLRPGDVVIVGAGETIPVDGTITAGEALVSQQTMTGEARPVDRAPGDRVFAVTIVEQGHVEVRADRTRFDTAVGRIVERVEAAAGEKSDIQAFAEQLAEREVGRTLVFAALGAGVARSIDAGIAVLVADYGTVARVGIPTAVVTALRRATRIGILVKGPRALQNLARVNTVVFDKTGTLTSGAPRVVRIAVYGRQWSEQEVIALAAAAERQFQHPVARAVTELARARHVSVPEPSTVAGRVGFGVEVEVDGADVMVGSRRFMESREVALAAAAGDEVAAHAMGASPIFVALGGRLAGMLVLQDQLRADAQEAVQALRARRMRNVILLTGDHPEPSRLIAETLGLRHHYAEMLPEDKARLIRQLKSEGRIVAMVGDGVNDGLALSEADVGIAVPGGAEVATEAADIVLLEGGLQQVIRAMDVAREGVEAVGRTLRIAAAANLGVVGLASLGLARPLTSILLSHGATVAAALATASGPPAAGPTPA
jgi:heavy metal translocating P-type ATPase